MGLNLFLPKSLQLKMDAVKLEAKLHPDFFKRQEELNHLSFFELTDCLSEAFYDRREGDCTLLLLELTLRVRHPKGLT